MADIYNQPLRFDEYVDADGKVTLPWGERVSMTDAMNLYYKDRKPGMNEVPAWARVSWQAASGTPRRFTSDLPGSLSGVFQRLYDNAYTTTGGPPQGGPAAGMAREDVLPFQSWQDQGYVQPDGMVKLPTGAIVSLTDAMNMYYKDRKPAANEVPPWVEGSGVESVRYFNQIPKDLRGEFEKLLSSAYSNGQTAPQIATMTGQAAYR